MGVALEVAIAVETAADVWTDLTDDVMIAEGVAIHYGISGDGPTDVVASTGECTFTLRGFKYSFHHADALTGWAFGARIRVLCNRTSDTAVSVSSITRSGSTATVTTASDHGWVTDNWITIAGASPSDYNGTFRITDATDSDEFEYSLGTLTPTTPASGTKTARLGYVKHNGRLRAANPTAGEFGSRFVSVVSYDDIRPLAETDAKEVALQINKTEIELMAALLDSLPADAQPLNRDLDDTGVDTYPYAFDGLGAGRTALSVMKDIAVSAFALVYMKGDGTLAMRTRDTRAVGASAFSFSNDMTDLVTNASVDSLVNNVQCTIYPRTVDAAATTVVYSTTGTPLSVAGGDTLTLVVEYRSPTDDKELIGATAVVDATATTDYLGNSNVSGTGDNLTSDLTVTTTKYASSAKLEIANSGSATVYLVNASGVPFLQLRGKGIYQSSAQTFTSLSVQDYGDKTLAINLQYQSSPGNAQSYANTVQAQFNEAAAAQIDQLMFDGNSTDDLLQQALAREPSEIISVTETATGASSVEMVIQSVGLDITAGPWIKATFGLAPSGARSMWLLGTTGRSELGETTILGW
jgi:hypothetical protein